MRLVVTPPPPSQADRDRRMYRLYAGVIAVEMAVVLGIWLFQRYFGS